MLPVMLLLPPKSFADCELRWGSGGVFGNPKGLTRDCQSAAPPSVNVAIHLPDQAFVVLRRVHVVQHCRIVHGDDRESILVGLQDGGGSVARGQFALERGEQSLVPDPRGPAAAPECR